MAEEIVIGLLRVRYQSLLSKFTYDCRFKLPNVCRYVGDKIATAIRTIRINGVSRLETTAIREYVITH